MAKSVLNPLIILHKRIIKICLNKKIEYPTELIYSEFNVPTIEILYQIKLLAYYHKNYTKFKSNQHIYSTRRQQTFIPLIEPKCNTSAAMRHCTGYGPRLYNKLISQHPNLLNMNNYQFKKEINKLL